MNASEHSEPRLGEHNDATQPESTDRDFDPTLGMDQLPIPVEGLCGVALGDYLLLEPLGAGGGGRVFKAQHRHMDRIVAVKIFPQTLLANETHVKRFQREVRAAARLLNPNIVTAFDAGKFQSMYYLVMEYVDGESLASLVRTKGPQPVAQATDYIIQTAKGLGYAHSRGIIHRDIKPRNIMLDRAGNVKILDMGLARLQGVTPHGIDAADASAELTAQGILLGTIGYISPEQIDDARKVDERTDIYSLGCTYYFLLTGQAPYVGTMLEILRAHAEKPIPRLGDVRLDVPEELDAVFQRMLAKDAADRQATMDQLVQMLAPFAEPRSDSKAPMPAPGTSSSRPAGASRDAGARARTVGFTVGTKNAYVSSMGDEGEPVCVAAPGGSIATPAAVLYTNATFQVGRPAVDAAVADFSGFADRLFDRLGTADSSRTVGGQTFPAEVLGAAVIAKVAEQTRQRIGDFDCLSYTVPGCYGDARRRGYGDAFFLSSCKTLAPLNASTAVALHFSFLHGWLNPQRKSPPKAMLVFRFGNGSFDATVYRLEDRRLSALAMAGDSQLGGFVWDDRIVRRVVDQLEEQHGPFTAADSAQLFSIRRECEAARRALSREKQRVPLKVCIGDASFEGTLTQGFMRKAGADLLARAEELTLAALSEAGVPWDALDHVLLAGGTSHMPMVRDRVKAWAGDREHCSLAGPEIAPSGAALYAHIQLLGPQPTLDFEVQDVSACDVGIRRPASDTQASQWKVVIGRNTTLPATGHVTVTKDHPRQSTIEFQVVEGSDGNEEPREIGNGRISDLPPGLPVGASVEVEFSLDRRGILSLFVESPATCRRSPVLFRPTHEMSQNERLRWKEWLVNEPSHCSTLLARH